MSQYDDGGWAILQRARELAEAGETCAVATVVWRQGPSSGHRGSRALVRSDGTLEGWIGGACAEPVVLREARSVIADHEPKLLYLGTSPDAAVPEGARFVAMSCQSEGALQIFIEPVLPVVDLVVVGRSPMTTMLTALASDLGWKVRSADAESAPSTPLTARSVVVVATQGHHDEEAVQWAVEAGAAFVGLVASQKRGEVVLGYLRDRGLAPDALARVRHPVGLDLGHTTHTEIAVSILAELVQLRAAGELSPAETPQTARTSVGRAETLTSEEPVAWHRPLPLVSAPRQARGTSVGALESAPRQARGASAGPVDSAPRQARGASAEAVDPVCRMTVTADDAHWPLTLTDGASGGTTYWFCCLGCHDRFAKDPAAYLTATRASTTTDTQGA